MLTLCVRCDDLNHLAQALGWAAYVRCLLPVHVQALAPRGFLLGLLTRTPSAVSELDELRHWAAEELHADTAVVSELPCAMRVAQHLFPVQEMHEAYLLAAVCMPSDAASDACALFQIAELARRVETWDDVAAGRAIDNVDALRTIAELLGAPDEGGGADAEAHCAEGDRLMAQLGVALSPALT